jgi:hypothetical protein
MTLTDRINRFDQMARSARWPKALVNLGHWSVRRKDCQRGRALGLANYEAARAVVSAGVWLSWGDGASCGPWHGLVAWVLGRVGWYLLRTSNERDFSVNLALTENVGPKVDRAAGWLAQAARIGLPDMVFHPEVTDQTPETLRMALATFTPELRARALIVLGEGLAAADRLRRSLSVAGFLVLPSDDAGEGDQPA